MLDLYTGTDPKVADCPPMYCIILINSYVFFPFRWWLLLPDGGVW